MISQLNAASTDGRIEETNVLLRQLVARLGLKEHYSVEEFAQLVGRRPYTVREWCRLGRVRGEKSMTHAGSSTQWVISHSEYLRYQREGLLPRMRAYPLNRVGRDSLEAGL